jgi:uncharacterized protein
MKFVRLVVLAMAFVFGGHASAESRMLSIGSGNTGGVYYPLAGGLAQVLSRHVPGWQVTAEVTGGSIDNLKLVGSGRADIGFSMADAAWDAYSGNDRFSGKKLPLRALVVLYPNRMHVVTVEGTGITSLKDLEGKRVSLGSPGGATEVWAMRILEAQGLHERIKRERLSVNESVNAIKDRKIDAFFWGGGVPTAAVTDLAATPGVKIQLLDHGDVVDALNKRYGPLYSRSVIPKSAYPGMAKDSSNVNVWNVLFVNATMPDDVAYAIVKTVFDRRSDMIAVHKEFATLSLDYQTAGAAAIPFHPGAIRFFAEKGLKLQ